MKPAHKLSAMMFFQYAILGAWHPVLSRYLLYDLQFNGEQVGVVYALISIASLSTSWLAGFLADRYVSAQKLLGFLHLAGGFIILTVSRQTHFVPFVILMGLYCMVYVPTISLNNSITFTHIKHREKEFSRIRVWGTMGWIVSGILLSLWRYSGKLFATHNVQADMLILAAGLSFVGSMIAFIQPHTPPLPKHEYTHYKTAIKEMISNRNIRFVLIAVFIVSTQVMLYYVLSAPLLTSPEVGLSKKLISTFLSFGQFGEIFVLAFLIPILLPKLGFKKIFILGLVAWILRYLLMAFFKNPVLLLTPVLLHGFCYAFIHTNTSIYIDHNVSSKIRNTAHGMVSVVIAGMGNLIGSLWAGWAQNHWTQDGMTDWQTIFIVPALILSLPVIFLIFGFRKKRKFRTPDSS